MTTRTKLMTDTHTTLADDLRALFSEVRDLCGTVDDELPEELGALENHSSDDDLRELLTSILLLIRANDTLTAADKSRIAGEVRTLVDGAVRARNAKLKRLASFPASEETPAGPANPDGSHQPITLFEWDGVPVRDVKPMQRFLGKEVPLREGYVNTKDIAFWLNNRRLEIDLQNFRRKEGREPDADELMRMLWPKGPTIKDDPYQIGELVHDIAARGVQTPPIIDAYGTVWEGNRRLASCLYILTHPGFSDDEKQRVTKIRVWQTSADATEDQVQAIYTALNFGESFKLQWPEYVRAREIADAVAELRDNEASRHTLSDRDETAIRQRVGKRFGIKTERVTRYCKLVAWADEFEDFHREQGRDENEINTRTSELTQYFVELDAGRGEDKLAGKFKDDEAFRTIVFDLLFEGKLKNWSQVRELRRVYEIPEAFDHLKAAHAEPSAAVARQNVSTAIDVVRQRSLVMRQAGRGDELGRIAKWLREDATLAVVSKLDRQVLREFRDAARAVDGMISTLVDAPRASATEADA
jgi:hypothetical protein